MSFLNAGLVLASFLVVGPISPQVAGTSTHAISFTGNSTDVVLTAQAVLAWDLQTGQVLYSKNATVERPIASLNKLIAVLAAKQVLDPNAIVEIPAAVRTAQAEGASIKLPIGEHVQVRQLFESGLVASAADSMVTLAVAAKGSENDFSSYANAVVHDFGLQHTRVANATGLSSDANHPQYSTAEDLRKILERVYGDPFLSQFLAEKKGVVVTQEGTRRAYTTTNKLLGTYLPVLAGKTGFTNEAGENLVLVTENKTGQKMGTIILGSQDRFQDTKVLVEWIDRNYTWNTP